MNVTTLAIDLAKRVFYLHGEDRGGHVVLREKLSRERLVVSIAKLPQCTIAMEAGAGAHHWARKFQSLGHQVRLIHPKFVRPFVKSNKNDWHDAAAICEAAQRPTMRFVAVKSTEQQDMLLAHRIRERLVGQRTGLVNQIRGLLNEYGVVIPTQVTRLRRMLPEVLEDAANGLTATARRLLAALSAELRELEERIKPFERDIERAAIEHEPCRRLRTIPGIGPMSATALVATMGDPDLFKNGRHFAAYLGLVPKQHSSGGKTQLSGISRRGDIYMRKLLIQGAHSVLQRIGQRTDRRSEWLRQLMARRGRTKTALALANKNARIAWRLLKFEESYEVSAPLAA
jgi:transposase